MKRIIYISKRINGNKLTWSIPTKKKPAKTKKSIWWANAKQGILLIALS